MSVFVYSLYDKSSDNQLVGFLEHKKNVRTTINPDSHYITASYLDREINYLTTLLRQRTVQNAAAKALKDKSDDEARMVEAMKEDDREVCDEVEVDDEVRPQFLPVPPLHHILCDKTEATSPPNTPATDLHLSSPIVPDIRVLIPIPLPSSPNIRYSPNPPLPPPLNHNPLDIPAANLHPHPPDILPPLPLPLKPNIPAHQQFQHPHPSQTTTPPAHVCFRCSRTNNA
jgi:hypothetical protein